MLLKRMALENIRKRKKIQKGIGGFLALLALTACDPHKDPLPGERQAYLDLSGTMVQPAPELRNRSIHIPAAKPCLTLEQVYGNAITHHAPVKGIEKESSTWSRSIGTSSDTDRKMVGHPVSDGKLIYTSDARGKISAVSVKDGSIVWSIDSVPDDASDSAFGAGLGLKGNVLFITSGVGDVIALQAATGKALWRVHVDAPMRVMPAIGGDRLFVTTIDGRTLALSQKDGTILWTHQGLSELSNILGGASPIIKDDYVVASYSSGEIYVLRADTGTPVWSETITTALRMDSISSIPHIVGNPIIENSILYVVSHGGKMAAFDLSTGMALWNQDLGSIRSPLLIGDYLFLLDNTNHAVCLEKSTGKIAWVVKMPLSPEKQTLTWTSPFAMNDKLLLGNNEGKLLMLSLADGHKMGEKSLKDGISVSPIVVEGALYVLLDSGDLVRF